MDKISLLNEVAVNGTQEEIDELIEISKGPSGDSTVDTMIIHTLRDLLKANEPAAVKLLDSEKKDHLLLALGIISRQKFLSSASRLLSLYDRLEDSLLKNDILQTMMDLAPKQFVNLFRREIRNPDSLLSSSAIRGLSFCDDHSQDAYLQQLVRDNEQADRYHRCALGTAQAIETLAKLGGEENLRFLSFSIHHKNPTARRLIMEQLSQIGDPVIPFLAPLFSEGNNDQKILGANLIAMTTGKLGGDMLLTVLDQGKAEDPNVRFAVYEALGSFQSMKSFVCLVEALEEKDPLILISVMTALNRYDFPFVAAKVSEKIDPGDPHGQELIKALIDSEADELIRKLHALPSLQNAISLCLRQAQKERNSDMIDTLCRDLIGEGPANSPEIKKDSDGPRIIAADDSLAIRKFYESTLSGAGYRVQTAVDGQNAFDMLQFNPYDLLITDLNMPNMDGIELAEKVRSEKFGRQLPIIMVTTESENSQRNLAEQQKINAYVNKPIKPDILLQTIRELLFTP